MPFEDNAHQTGYKQDFLPTVEINIYNVTSDRKSFFDQTVKHDRIAYDNLRQVKEMITQPAVYCIMFTSKNCYKMIAIDAYRKAAQQIYFTENLD